MQNAEDEKHEIETKRLVLSRIGHIPEEAKIIHLTQIYLKIPLGFEGERRVRKSVEATSTTYFYAEKKPTGTTGKRIETEFRISWLKYVWYKLFYADLACIPIIKTRYVYEWLGVVWEHDIYQGELKPLETLEAEVSSIEDLEGLQTPSFLASLDITADRRYSNRSLAEHGIPKLNTKN